MSDLYRAIAKLEALKKTFYTKRRLFITELLEAHNGALLKFKETQNISTEVIVDVIAKLRKKIDETSSITSPFLKRKLNKILKSFLKAKARIDEKQIKATSYGKRLDSIYEEASQFSGTVIAPFNQAMDYRLGDSEGVCAGFVLRWLKSFLYHQNPFGIHPQAEPLFKRIKYNSKTGMAYPDLNSFIVMSEDVSKFQKDIIAFQKSEEKKSGKQDKKIVEKIESDYFEKFKDSKLISDYLIDLSKDRPKKGLYLRLTFEKARHALGFFKDKAGNLHFLDANAGWFRFSNENDFRNWFSFYFNKIGYESMCRYYCIFSFERECALTESHEVKVPLSEKEVKKEVKKQTQDDIDLNKQKQPSRVRRRSYTYSMRSLDANMFHHRPNPPLSSIQAPLTESKKKIR